MSYFGNDAINRVNLHYGIQQLAQGAGGVFVFVFLLRAGVSVPLTLCTLAAMVGGRFLLRPLVLPLAQRLGIRTTVIAGTVLEAAMFPLLPLVKGPDRALLAVIAVGAVGSVIYWTSYHAYFAALGDTEHRGGQVGAREAISAVVGVIAPLLGGWALVTAGPTAAFAGSAVVQALAVLPLLSAPQVPVQREPPARRSRSLRRRSRRSPSGWRPAAPRGSRRGPRLSSPWVRATRPMAAQ